MRKGRIGMLAAPLLAFQSLLVGRLAAEVTSPLAEVADPRAAMEEIVATTLDPASGHLVRDLEIVRGPATIRLREGAFIPSTPLAGAPREAVFLGRGSVTIHPPDDVEAAQLELFTGSQTLEADFEKAVFVFPRDFPQRSEGWIERGAVPSARDEEKAFSLWRAWKDGPHRGILQCDRRILGEILGHVAPGSPSSFAAWISSEKLGDFVFRIDPEEDEGVVLGRFVPFADTENEKRNLERALAREQRRMRLLEVDAEDLGVFDTWMRAAVEDGGSQIPKPEAPFQAEKYTIDARVRMSPPSIEGTAVLEVTARRAGCRILDLALGSSVRLQWVADASGRTLPFLRWSNRVAVGLVDEPEPGERIVLRAGFEGNPFVSGKAFLGLAGDGESWHPRLAGFGRSTWGEYDVTLAWPKRLALVAGGVTVDGGKRSGRDVWERRRVEVPSWTFPFAIGDFRFRTVEAGKTRIAVAFDRDFGDARSKAADEIVETARKSFEFYEATFGPIPRDEIVVVTVPGLASVSWLGYVTLAHSMVQDVYHFFLAAILPDRRAIVAHEIAHQWWGHHVSTASYRDTWLSEGMATYASLLYLREKVVPELRGSGTKEGQEWPVLLRAPTAGWRRTLGSFTADGRTVESLGPIVLGPRLVSSKGGAAYPSIVYQKGGIVLDMLSKVLSQERFLEMLRAIWQEHAGRELSTSEFFASLEHISGESLSWLVEQYVYGTGIPQAIYSHAVEPSGTGRFAVTGSMELASPYRCTCAIEKLPEGGHDVVRSCTRQTDVGKWRLVVPFEIPVLADAPADGSPDPSPSPNATIVGRLMIRDPESPYRVEVDREPLGFVLDPRGEVLARFVSATRYPKAAAIFRARELAAKGRLEEAEAMYRSALDAPARAGDATVAEEPESTDAEARTQDAFCRLHLARIALDRGRLDDAGTELARIGDGPDKMLRPIVGERLLLEARLALRRGDPEKAYESLGGRRADRWSASNEEIALLALSARASRHEREFRRALDLAKRRGIDVRSLE